MFADGCHCYLRQSVSCHTRASERTLKSSDVLDEFKHSCGWLLTAYPSDQLERALMGLYYSAKSTVIAPRVVDSLLLGNPNEVIAGGKGDDACFVAESMLRSVHSMGDLLAQVVNICICESVVPANRVSLPSVIQKLRALAANPDGGTHQDFMFRVADSLDVLLESEALIYLTDFTNTVKHREYVERSLITTATGCSMAFAAFEKDGRRHEAKAWMDVCVVAESVRDECLCLLKRIEQEKNYELMVTNGGTLVGSFLSLTATPSVYTAEQFSGRTLKRLPDDESDCTP